MQDSMFNVAFNNDVWLRQGAHFYSAASLKCHAPDIWRYHIQSHYPSVDHDK